LARAFFATWSAFASALELRLFAGLFIDAVQAACFASGVLTGQIVFTARFAGLPVTRFALRAAFATCFAVGLTRRETVTFLATLALAFVEILVTGWKRCFAMVREVIAP